MNQASPTRLTARRRFLVLSFATLGLSPLGSQLAQAASATWSATPTNGMWEAAGAEANWSTGAGPFPGTTSGATNSTDVATFTGVSNVTAISVNSTAGNSLPLNLGGMTFTGANKSSWTIGSTTGNALWFTATNANDNTSTLQTVISGAGSSGTGGTETINSPIVLQPASSHVAGFSP